MKRFVALGRGDRMRAFTAIRRDGRLAPPGNGRAMKAAP
jgi:hypothetical protein